MPPLLVTSVEHPRPRTPPALPHIVPQVSYSRVNSISYQWPNGKRVANTIKSLQDT
ncbi:hypothetical protein BDV30DRAFT_208555 [Aspergillus minisclerotigenes]|uniref:Uncharacterized protein n=1 Tax=Aspergillus minisclerotigenes TaxID=656917 RepID=A0A5N6J884_9EURO|nr:hypothetical protein BDV30DRAFT_208555 [Aspergillus minisclerotigenes]